MTSFAIPIPTKQLNWSVKLASVAFTMGGVVVLLTWLWLSAYIVILGAMVDAERGD